MPYQDSSLPVPVRVTDLLSRMSMEELIGQTWHPEPQPNDAATLTKLCAKGVGGTGTLGGGTPLLRLQNRNALQRACMAAQPHGIPLSFHEEGLHAGALGGTQFPEPLLTACSWNESLATAIGAAIAFEARGAGVDNVWSPVGACVHFLSFLRAPTTPQILSPPPWPFPSPSLPPFFSKHVDG